MLVIRSQEATEMAYKTLSQFVINYQPLEAPKSLRRQTIINLMQGMGAVKGGNKNGDLTMLNGHKEPEKAMPTLTDIQNHQKKPIYHTSQNYLTHQNPVSLSETGWP